MKKILILGLSFGFVALNAQTQKGNWIVEGSTALGFSSGKTTHISGSTEVDGATTSVISFVPAVGYFISDNLALNTELSLTSITNRQEIMGTTYKETSSIFAFMPGVSYFFSTNNKSLMPYLGGNIGYASKKFKEDGEGVNGGGFAWKAKGGLAFFVNPAIAINLGLSYSQMTFDYSDTNLDYKERYSPFGLNVGFSLFL